MSKSELLEFAQVTLGFTTILFCTWVVAMCCW